MFSPLFSIIDHIPSFFKYVLGSLSPQVASHLSIFLVSHFLCHQFPFLPFCISYSPLHSSLLIEKVSKVSYSYCFSTSPLVKPSFNLMIFHLSLGVSWTYFMVWVSPFSTSFSFLLSFYHFHSSLLYPFFPLSSPLLTAHHSIHHAPPLPWSHLTLSYHHLHLRYFKHK